MKKFQYSVRVKTNKHGAVAQHGDDVVGSKTYTETGYFKDLDTLLGKLRCWTGGRYEFFLSPDDVQFNAEAPKVPYDITSDVVAGKLAWDGPYEHNHLYIKVREAA